MSMNPLNDISAVYFAEVLKPQLGKSSPAPATAKPEQKKTEASSGPGDAGAKRIRQAVYDIRYRARREDIPLPQAYSQYMSHTSMNAVEKNAVRDKLGMGPGGGASVKEEVTQKKYQVRVTPKKGFGNPYVRYATDSKIAQLRSNPQISSVEKTKYGTPYEGEKESGEQTRDALQHKPDQKKAKKDYDRDGKVETSTQEWKGSRDNAIKKAMGVRKEAVEVPSGDIKTLVKKASKRVDSDVTGFVNGDDSSDKTMGVFIPSPDGKKKVYGTRIKEGFSDWRNDLSEVVDDDIIAKGKKEVKEKKVNNKVVINPQLGEEIQILETVELSEEYITESANIAAEYFYEHGLNEIGVEILIEDLGLDEFVSFVFEIENEVISEARTLTGKKKSPATGKERGVSLKAAPGKTTKTAVEKYGTTRKLSSSTSPTIKKKSVAIKKAVEKQPETKSSPSQTKKGIAGRVGAALGSIVKKGKEDIKRVQDAAQTARDVATRRGAEAAAVYSALRAKGKEAEKSATATRARRKATVAAGRAAQAAGKTAIKAAGAAGAAAGEGLKAHRQGKTGAQVAGRAAGTFVRKMTKEELELLEKAESEQQQKLFGLALSVKRGETPRSEVSDSVLKIVDTMSEKKIRDFAKTKHEGIPQKVEEAIVDQPGSADNQVRNTQDDTVKRQQLKKKEELLRKQQALERQRMLLQKSGKLPLNTGYELEGEIIDERRREEKGTPRKPEPSAAFKAVSKMMGSGRLGVQPRGKKKDRGGPTPGPSITPAQKVANRRAAAQRAQDNMSSRFD